MYGFTGITNFNKNISNDFSIIRNMTKTLKKVSCFDEEDFYFSKETILGQNIATNIDNKNIKNPISYKYNENIYTITFYGNIYNKLDIKNSLEKLGFSFSSNNISEILVKSFIYYGYNICNYLNGVFSFAIWNETKKELFLARDHFGIKPLYYTFNSDNFIFSTEIKAILEHPDVSPVLNEIGICELFGIRSMPFTWIQSL